MKLQNNCKFCQNSIESRKIFCNRICYTKYGRPHLRKPELDINCEWCNEVFHSPKTTANRRFCSVKCRGEWQSSLPYEDWKQKLSDNKENRARGRKNGMWGKTAPHGKWLDFKSKDGRELRLRSSWELAVARYLDQKDIEFEYEEKRFEFNDCTYLPDFYLIEDEVYWEIKGWLSPRSKRQIDAFRRECPEIPLVVIDKQTIDHFASATNTKVSK